MGKVLFATRRAALVAVLCLFVVSGCHPRQPSPVRGDVNDRGSRSEIATTPADRLTNSPEMELPPALDQAFRVRASNLANARTAGFKRQIVVISPDSSTIRTHRDMSAGVAEEVEGQFNLMIQGDGFLAVQAADGSISYTRCGVFRPDVNGEMAHIRGECLYPSLRLGQPLSQIHVSDNGWVTAMASGTVPSRVIGQMTLYRFADLHGLETKDGVLFTATAASGPPQPGRAGDPGFGRIVQGMIEQSNVHQDDEMAEVAALVARVDAIRAKKQDRP